MSAGPLPSNADLLAFSDALPWADIERTKRKFNEALQRLAAQHPTDDTLPLDELSRAAGVPLTTLFDPTDGDGANVILAENNGYRYVLGSHVVRRYRKDKSRLASIVPYNLNPSVNHTTLPETDAAVPRMSALGAEIELGLYRPEDGTGPTEEQMEGFRALYQEHARLLGITPQVDKEACQYQIECHVAPGIGYYKTRASVEGILRALAATSHATGLYTAISSCYPVESDFFISRDPKVQTAAELMSRVNRDFPAYGQRLQAARERYHLPEDTQHIHAFRIQGCHIHLDLAGRSEALGLFIFTTLLRSASAIAGGAVLKGGPFVNGTCDPELLCVREHLRHSTVTGNIIPTPTSPHLSPDGLHRYGALLNSDRVNAVARAMLIDDALGQPVSAMHNGIGRVRPDLGSSKRICTVESTGLPVNVSAARMAAVLTDFEFSHALLELYFRRHGCDLEPMFADQTLWAILGPLSAESFRQQHDQSDRLGSDTVITTAAGTQMTLADFYEMKRRYLHRATDDLVELSPRDIDDVYMSLTRMLEPPSGKRAQTIDQYICDAKLKSTGNWGQILRNAFEEAGGTPGSHNPAAVLAVSNQVHEALHRRYLGS